MRVSKKRLALFKTLGALILVDFILNLTITLPPLDNHGIHIVGPPRPREWKISNNTSHIVDNKNNDDVATFNVLTRAVFYNVYLNPTTGTTVLKSLKIVEEQLNYVVKSLEGLGRSTHVYYNIIGHHHKANICKDYPQLNCTLLGYHEQGGEDLTLQDLYNYCVAHPRHRVSYLHDKGSFRQASNNNRSRRRATRGAVSVECLQMPLSADYQCNMCGSKYQVLPHPNYQGKFLLQVNMTWNRRD